MHASTPPRSDRRAVGGAWSFAIDPETEVEVDVGETFVRFVLPASVILLDRTLRFPGWDSGDIICASEGEI